MAENQYDFPTEVLDLPSKGLLYPKDNPLSSGTIEIKYMTAKEEDILTSTNLIQQGTVLDKLFESVIADKSIKLKDMLIGDKNAIMLGARILGYGKDYPVEITDPDSGLKKEIVVDLSGMKFRTVDDSLFEGGENKFTIELPNAKRTIEFKLLTHGDEKEVDETVKALKSISNVTGVDPTLTTRLKQQIISVDGNTTKKIINNFVDNEFLALDTREFREYAKSITPDIDMSVEYVSGIGEPHMVEVPIGVTFFWPKSRV
jgi:hypothetical protein